MRFMMLMIPKGYETAVDLTPDDEAHLDEMMVYNKAMADAGILRGGEGLHPPSAGKRVSFKGGKPLVTDGPFAEAKEVLGGFWLIEVGSLAEAVEWAKRCPGNDRETIEVRQVQSVEDWPEHLQEKAGGWDELRKEL